MAARQHQKPCRAEMHRRDGQSFDHKLQGLGVTALQDEHQLFIGAHPQTHPLQAWQRFQV